MAWRHRKRNSVIIINGNSSVEKENQRRRKAKYRMRRKKAAKKRSVEEVTRQVAKSKERRRHRKSESGENGWRRKHQRGMASIRRRHGICKLAAAAKITGARGAVRGSMAKKAKMKKKKKKRISVAAWRHRNGSEIESGENMAQIYQQQRKQRKIISGIRRKQHQRENISGISAKIKRKWRETAAASGINNGGVSSSVINGNEIGEQRHGETAAAKNIGESMKKAAAYLINGK